MSRRKTGQDDIELFFDQGLHVPSRTIYLDHDIEEDGSAHVGPQMASKVVKSLAILETASKEPITILMNCPGGNVTDGLAIFDAIQACDSHVVIKVLGEAASMGAFILQAADERVMYPFSRLMFHDGDISTHNNQREVEKLVEHEKMWRFRLYNMLAQRTGLKAAYFARKMTTDWYLTAEQALSEKLIDRIENGE